MKRSMLMAGISAALLFSGAAQAVTIDTGFAGSSAIASSVLAADGVTNATVDIMPGATYVALGNVVTAMPSKGATGIIALTQTAA